MRSVSAILVVLVAFCAFRDSPPTTSAVKLFVFAQVYRESVPQDLRPGSEVMRISATDIDDGNNSIVAYELHTVREEERGYFRVDRATGVITLNRTIDVSI